MDSGIRGAGAVKLELDAVNAVKNHPHKLKTVSILDPNILKMIFFNIIINLNKLNENLFFLL